MTSRDRKPGTGRAADRRVHLGHHGIVPPYILEALSRHGTPEQRVVAAQTLAVDAALRAQRALVAPDVGRRARVTRREDRAALRKHRSIHDCGNDDDLPGDLVRDEGDPATGDVDVDRVYDGLGNTWDLYQNLFGRNSFDDDGGTMTASVHYRTNYANAFWNGEQFAFGDGDGAIFTSMTAAVDVMAHEFTHGVISHASDLEYEGQSGALNEHLADVFGSLVKQRFATPQQTAAQADWLIGAGLFAAGINGVALRSMIAPGTAFNDPNLGQDPQPDHMNNFVVTDDDNGGVHINSGIPNRAFVLFAQALDGFAWDRAGRVWYDAMTSPSLPKDADFETFATLTADRAYALFGHDVARACVDAWATVGVTCRWNRHRDRTLDHGAPSASGTPTATVLPGLGVSNIAYRSSDGHLHELWNNGGTDSGTSDLTSLAGAPGAAGDPFAYADHARNTEILLFRSGDGRVRSLYWSTGPVGHDDLSGTAGSPAASGTPVGYHHQPSDGHHVIYRGTDKHLHELVWFGVAPVFYGGNLTGTIGAPQAAGDPAAYSTPDGTNIVPYRAGDGRILSVYWKDGPSGLDDLSGTAGTPKASSDPVAFHVPATDSHHVFYVGTDRHVYELSWVGVAPVSGRDLTALAGAPLATGRPTAFFSSVHQVFSVTYRRDDGHLEELWWAPGQPVSHGDVTANSAAPPASGSPVGFVVDADRSAHLAFRGTDGHVHEITWR